MASTSLTFWTHSRTPSLNAIDAQCAASLTATPANPLLADENVRGFGLLLSAHFQGFCRDLYAEAAQIIALKVRLTLRLLIQEQFMFRTALGHGNPNNDNIKADFGRFGFNLDSAKSDPANAPRLGHLAALNRWRNVAAHHGVVTQDDTPSLADLRLWSESCHELAVSLDETVYSQLRTILRRKPWKP